MPVVECACVCAHDRFHVWACLLPACYWRLWTLVTELSGKDHHLNAPQAQDIYIHLVTATTVTSTAEDEEMTSVRMIDNEQQTPTPTLSLLEGR